MTLVPTVVTIDLSLDPFTLWFKLHGGNDEESNNHWPDSGDMVGAVQQVLVASMLSKESSWTETLHDFHLLCNWIIDGNVDEKTSRQQLLEGNVNGAHMDCTGLAKFVDEAPSQGKLNEIQESILMQDRETLSALLAAVLADVVFFQVARVEIEKTPSSPSTASVDDIITAGASLPRVQGVALIFLALLVPCMI